MEDIAISAAIFAIIFVYLGVGVWIFAGLIAVGLTAILIFGDFTLARAGLTLQSTFWNSARTWELSAIPLFIWMGDILFRANVSERLFRGIAPWVDWLPGRLLHTNVVGCTLFAAVSGSSTATAATVGKFTIKALGERGYSQRLSIGSLAGSGAIGLMIPPSIPMIIYGVLAEVSISKLFVAGILPGLLLAALYSTYIVIRSLISPELAPKSEQQYTMKQRFVALLDLLPVLAIIVLVIGGIYSGLATPSEAAAIGVVSACLIAALLGKLNLNMLRQSLMSSVLVSCMICTILVAASFLSVVMGFLHIPMEVANSISALNLGPYGLILLLTFLYLLLGCLLDGVSLIVMTLPIVLPLVVAAGFDPIWFGIYVVLMIELAMITPPIGFNLFVLQGLSGQPIGEVAVAALPFFALLIVAAILLTLFPQIALWLPAQLAG